MAILIPLAVISDWKTFSIKNQLIFTFIIAGILTNFYYSGPNGVLSSILGAVLPILLLFALYALRMLGAGDIKLFSAVGAVMGVKFVLYCIACSFLSGGIIAIFIIIVRKNAKQRLIHLFTYLKLCFLTLSLKPYTDFADKSDGAKFQFAWAIACGSALTVILELL